MRIRGFSRSADAGALPARRARLGTLRWIVGGVGPARWARDRNGTGVTRARSRSRFLFCPCFLRADRCPVRSKVFWPLKEKGVNGLFGCDTCAAAPVRAAGL